MKKRLSVIGYGVLGALFHAMRPDDVVCLEYRTREEVIGPLDREAPFTYSKALLAQFIQKIPSLSQFLETYASLVHSVHEFDENGVLTKTCLVAPRYSFTRRDLMSWFVSRLSASDESVRFNQKVLKIDPDKKSILIGNQTPLNFEVLVIANGIYSTLLQEKCLIQDPHRSFIKLDADPMPNNGHLEVYHHDQGFVIRYPLGISRSVCLWSAPTETLSKNRAELAVEFESYFPLLACEVLDLKKQFETHPVTPILYRAPHSEIHHSEIVMGDARAAVFPSGGLGADFMLETILTVCDLLESRTENIVDAFYERHPYSQIEGLFQKSLELAVSGAFLVVGDHRRQRK